jgi:hypothetical protein
MQGRRSPASRSQRTQRITAVLLGAAVATWVATAVSFAFVIPAMLADTWPLASPESAAAGTRIAGVIGAIVGIALLVGTLAVLARSANPAGRLVLVVAGITAVVVGLLHTIGGLAFLQHGAAMRPVAITMLVQSTAFVAAGVFACAAAVSRLLPGQSLAEWAMVRPPPLARDRRRMLAPTVVAAAAWAAVVGLFMATMRPGIEMTAITVGVFLATMLVPPTLAGALIGAWREGAPNRLSTLGLAAAAGVAANWSFLVIEWLWELARFPGQDLASGSLDLDVPISFAILGAFAGAAGYGLQSMVTRHLSRLHVHPR